MNDCMVITERLKGDFVSVPSSLESQVPMFCPCGCKAFFQAPSHPTSWLAKFPNQILGELTHI